MEDVELTKHESEVSLVKPEPQKSWIERVFQKRECRAFIPSGKDRNRCGCGRLKTRHYFHVDISNPGNGLEKWNPQLHTDISATDAYGTIEFQGGPHPTKAQYVRLSYDTHPNDILRLLQQQWNLEVPNLLISVHGGIANFDLQPKLKRVFKKGLSKAAKTTGAWIVSAGINTGVVRHVGDALGDTLVQARNNIVTLGIAPWGVVHNRSDLIGRDVTTPYHAIAAPKTNNVVLNSNHSYFLLVDNGTVGKYGCEILLRKKLEKYIQQQKIVTRSGTKNYSTPVVSLVLEGGTNTIRTVLECITDTPPVPVVVCDGSGRAADLLAFTHKYAQDDGTMPETLRDQLLLTVEKTFQYTREQAEKLFIELMLCVKKKELITVFRMGEGNSQDIDLAILTALLKAQNASATDQLSLALTWNRVDIARSHIFVYGQEWPDGALDQAMTDALVNDRVDFVKLLLENGVSMQKWLTISRLEELYNIKQDSSSTLRYLIKENKKHIPSGYRYSLYDIGQVIEQLMGGAYQALFCRRHFRVKYNAVMRRHLDLDGSLHSKRSQEAMGHTIGNFITELPVPIDLQHLHEPFSYPYNELLVWAVLLKRQKMAKFMWEHGEEALAKSLVACKLYKSMAHEAAQDDLEVDISEELKGYAREFAQLALDLLEQCYKNNDDLAQQLLTYELTDWSDQTCLSLAVAANHREFIAHTCCQILLTEMWMGALRMRKYTTLKVVLGILLFPSIVCLEFKSKEELQWMPQTMEEHMHDIEDTDSDSSTTSDMEDEVPVNESSFVGNGTGIHKLNGPLFFGQLKKMRLESKKSGLRLPKKFYEFYTAPISKFWAHSLGYLVFLLVLTYIVLIRMPPLPSWQEWFVIAYVVTFTMEKFREMKDLVNFVVILLIVLMAFGTVRQSVTFPNEEPSWDLAKHIFLKPYFMLYGEVYAPEIDPVCSDTDPDNEFKCVPGRWVVPAVMTVYLIVANILLINLLIAVFNNTFHRVNAISKQVWKFQRYSLVIEYEGRPILPPPFIILCHLYLLVRFFIRRCQGKGFHFDNGLKLFIDKEEVENLHDFEEEAMQDLFRMSEERFKSCQEERIKVTNDRVENMSLRFDDINQKENNIRLSLQTVDYRLVKLEELALQSIDMIGNLQHTLGNMQSNTPEEMITANRQRGSYLQPQQSLQYMQPQVSKFETPNYKRRKSKSEDRLRPFTTYQQQQQRTYHPNQQSRPPFLRSVSAGSAPVPLQRELENMYNSYVTGILSPPMYNEVGVSSQSFDRQSNTATYARKGSAPSFDSVELYNRRRKRFGKDRTVSSFPEHGTLHEDPEHFEEETHAHSPDRDSGCVSGGDVPKVKTKVTFNEQTSTYSTSKDSLAGTTASAAIVNPNKHRFCHSKSLSHNVQKPTSLLLASKQKSVDYGDGIADLPSVLTDEIGLGSVQSVDSIMVNDFSKYNTNVTAPLTPIITPTRSDYTSITDDIDTSCLNYCSPHGSPTTPRVLHFPSEVGVDMYTKKDKRKRVSVHKAAIKTEAEQLKNAEESEHELMELMIRKRMRQISLTDTDSFSNIAKHLVELENSDTDNEQGCSYHSDEGTSKPSIVTNSDGSLKKLNSDPLLHSSSSNHSIRQSLSEERSIKRSVSPPTVAVQSTELLVMGNNNNDNGSEKNLC